MAFFYSISIRLYAFLIWLVSPFNAKAKLWIDGRKNFLQQLDAIPSSDQYYWFHCASLGEFDMGNPLMKAWKQQHPNAKILVTFFSPSGYQFYTKREHVVDEVLYLPIDTKKNATLFLQKIQPKAVFFIKYEFWKNYIQEAKNRHIPVFSICSIFREKQAYFQIYGSFFRKILNNFTFFYLQDASSGDLLEKIGLKNWKVVGDNRFDAVIANRQRAKSFQAIEEFLNHQKAIILGSSWEIDEQLFQEVLAENSTEKYIIAPHEIGEHHLQSIEKRWPQKTIRYSQLSTTNADQPILILDSIGMLNSVYQYGKLAYVGGGFTGKLHNILEPAVFGLPVIFGPKHSRFPEAQTFIDQGFGFSVSSHDELVNNLSWIEENQSEIQQGLLQYMQTQHGVSAKIIGHLSSTLFPDVEF